MYFPIDVTKKHTLALSEARDKTEQVAKKMEAQYKLHYQWGGDTITFEAKEGLATGVKGYLRVTAYAIVVHIDLTLAQLGAKSIITDQVHQYLRDAGIR